MEKRRNNIFFVGSAAGLGKNAGLWKVLFWSILIFYCLYYAPFGVNETDGGFLSGLAWQVLNGKTLYGDVIYVRPPLPVWLRAGEMMLLPDNLAVLGERWIFYLKVGLYSWLGAAVLSAGARMWILSCFGFIVSVHCYPPMAWHTVDGILFSVLGIWWASRNGKTYATALAGICIFAAMLCKQSFYPMAAVFAWLLIFDPNFPKINNFRKVIFPPRAGWGIAVFLLCIMLFISCLYAKNLLENYFRLTGGSASGSQALQHGVFDYFRIKPAVAFFSLLFLTPVVRFFWKGKNPRVAAWGWALFLAALALSYALDIRNRQEFSPPFAQTRLLFWVGFVFAILPFRRLQLSESPTFPNLQLLALLAVSWCASVSWGYNLPALFSTPWVFAAMEISRLLRQQAYPRMRLFWPNIVALAMLLLIFRFGYEYVYRDGRRSEMDTPLGAVFPRLGGIYSTYDKGQHYLELKHLASRYPNFKTLPAFPQADFLTDKPPLLPLDWVVNRETNNDNTLIIKEINEKKPVFFIEKKYLPDINADPELKLTRDLLSGATILDETAHFWVIITE